MAISTETALLLDIALILMGAAVVAIIFTKLRLPLVVGYLLVGMILGPYVLGIETISEYVEEVNFLANLGIIFLMFYIGLEFNLKRLRRIGSFAILAGTIEILIMLVIGYEVGKLLGWSNVQSIYLGGVIAISSTAVIIKVLVESGKLDSTVGESVVGLLIVEDVAAVVLLTIFGSLNSGDSAISGSLLAQMGSIAVFFIITLILGLAIVPRVLNWIGRTSNNEVLLIVALGFTFGMAIFAMELGLSVAIGAFLMGIIVSEYKEGERIAKRVEPLKDVFMAIFFVSIGLLINPNLIADTWLVVLILVVVFIVGKIFAVTIAAYSANRDMRTSVTTGFAMVAMGEFSFVIAKTGLDAGSVDEAFYSDVIGVAVITMALMPFIFKSSNSFLENVQKHIPRSWVTTAARLDSLRNELGNCLAVRADLSKLVKYEIFWIIIDFVILFLIQLVVIALYDLSELLDSVADWLKVIPSTLATIVSVALIIPPVVDIMRRTRIIVLASVRGILKGGKYQSDSGRLILTLLFNSMMVIIGIVLFLAVLPLAPFYEGVPIIAILGIVVGIVVAYLIWGANKATYEKVCGLLGESFDQSERERR
jgi:monovalent cation:H+ antiporter-2, CPA2 family